MPDTFFIESPAGVPWTFEDRDRVLVGAAPGMVAQVVHKSGGVYNVLLTDGRSTPLSEGRRAGIAKAVAFVLESGDRLTCRRAPRLPWDECSSTDQKLITNGPVLTDGPSSTVSFSQVREFSA